MRSGCQTLMNELLQRSAGWCVSARHISSRAVFSDCPPQPFSEDDLARIVANARGRAPHRRAIDSAAFASYSYQYRATIRGYVRELAGKARYRDRLKRRQSDIDHDHLLDLILRQRGLCAYSGVPMEMVTPNSHWRMSLERMDLNFRYMQGNCCLIAAEFNSAVCKTHADSDACTAQWSRDKVANVLNARSKLVQLNQLHASIQAACVRPTSRRASNHGFRGPSQGRFICTGCGLWKEVEDFYTRAAYKNGLSSTCRKCMWGAKQLYLQTLRGHALYLLAAARQRARRKAWTGSFGLDLQAILDMLWRQRGRCYYSGVPLHCAFGPADWIWSLERLDNALTYAPGNCVLIARLFNTSDQSRNKTKHTVFGTAQWSRRKACHIWGSFYPTT